jgi:hypothetical protein
LGALASPTVMETRRSGEAEVRLIVVIEIKPNGVIARLYVVINSTLAFRNSAPTQVLYEPRDFW